MWGRQAGVGLVDTEEMAVFFERLDHVNQEQLLSMRAAWHSTSREAHEEAWAAVRAVGAREGLTKEIDRVRKKALGWVLRGTNAVPFFHRNDDVSWQQAKMEASEAIVDAALAVALAARLDERAHDSLMGPWLRAMDVTE